MVNLGRAPVEHWHQNADDDVWIGWAAYTGYVTPSTITRINSTLVALNSTGPTTWFYYQAYNNADTTLYASVGLNATGTEVGLMVDDGENNADGQGADNFCRMFLEYPSATANANLAFEYRTGGGAVTKATYFSIPPGNWQGLVAIGLGSGLLAALVVLPAIGALREAGAGFTAQPHAPEGGAARRLLGPFHVTGVFWVRFHLFGVRRFAWAAAVGVPQFTAFFWVVLRRIRRAVASNLEAALGPCGPLERERRLFRTFLAFAWCQTERYENLAGAATMRFEVEGVEHWREVAESGAGFVVLTAHVGHWEAGSMLPASRFERPIHVVREEELPGP